MTTTQWKTFCFPITREFLNLKTVLENGAVFEGFFLFPTPQTFTAPFSALPFHAKDVISEEERAP